MLLYCSKAKENLKIEKTRISFYCCGPTVYGPAHIGNFRAFVMQDVLRRTLELNGIECVHVRNITDIDDKIITKAKDEGKDISEVSSYWRKQFEHDCELLNLLSPHHSPSAVEYIPSQIEMIAKLFDKGYAYRIDDDVYFDTTKFERYGELSGCGAGELSRVDNSHKRDKRDFVLWKGDTEINWDSPFGKGRPGWHIECSAMATAILGNTIDIHSGGEDLLFPHHENEVAQSEACTGEEFVRQWHHVSHLMVDGSKMSKSLGNLFTLADLEERGYTAQDLRYLYLGTHYRKPLNFTFEALSASRKVLDKIRCYVEGVKCSEDRRLIDKILEGLNFDLNTSVALSVINRAISDKIDPGDVAEACMALGFDFSDNKIPDIPEEVLLKAQHRFDAKRDKDYDLADRLRREIECLGFQVVDTQKGFEIKKKLL